MKPIHFSLTLSGVVQPNGGDVSANHMAMTPGEVSAHLADAVSNITGEGLITGETPATLEEHETIIFVSTSKYDMLKMPVISTAHLDQATARELEENAAQCRWALVAPYSDGMFLRFFDTQGLETEPPEAATHIRAWLKRQGHGDWVRLDRDWECVADLPTYEW